MTQTVLLTGGFGNLGGRIAASLSGQLDISLRLASRSTRDVPSWAPSAEVVRLDVNDPRTFQSTFRDVDTVVHLVAISDVDSATDPAYAKTVTEDGTKMVLDAAIAANVSRFIYFSTAHVYGAPLVGFFDETSPTCPIHPYATTHLAAEQAVTAAHEEGKVIGIVLRCANSFGRPMRYEMGDWRTLTGDLCRQLVFENTLTLQSNGLQERNFITRTDVCSAVTHFLRLDSRRK